MLFLQTKDSKGTTVAFDKTDSVWYPKEIPVYPYRQNDLIAQCYLGDEKFSELIERPRKISVSPRFLGRSHSQSQKDHTHTPQKKRFSRYKSNDHGPSPSDLVINPRELNSKSHLFSPDNSLRLTSSAREIRQLSLREEDRLSNTESGSRGSVRSDEAVKKKAFSSSMEDILNDSPG